MKRNKSLSEKLNKSLHDIYEKATESIKDLLDKRMNTNSINMDYYQREESGTWYSFLGFNKDGYGVAVHIDIIKKVKGNYIFEMVNEDGDVFEKRMLSDFTAQDTVNILNMLEQVFYYVDNCYNGKILPDGYYDYDEYEYQEPEYADPQEAFLEFQNNEAETLYFNS